MKTIVFFIFSSLLIIGCSSEPKQTIGERTSPPKKEVVANDGKGFGEIKEVKLNNPLDENMAKRGEAIFDMKCAACHRLTAQRVVGPGWAGLTERRKPEWIMNMITNVDVMLEKDPEAQKLLEECLTRMPNQNVSVGDARDLLEFAFHNDAEQKKG